MLFFLQHGYWVVAHDRRGHGRSTQTGDGHDMDHYADGLAALTAHPLHRGPEEDHGSCAVMHGDDDPIVPYADSGPLSAELVQNGTLET